jgi:[acyl-carrier-protein] S-malonyltransferase
MGKDLADRFPAAREIFAAADDELGISLSRLMWEGDDAELTLTHNAQPAILVHSMAVLETIRGSLAPAAAAGHSLGEYTAYCAARSLSFRDAVRLVRRRGELMLAAGEKRPGTMAVVLGLDATSVEEACRRASGGKGVAVAANLNSPEQIVISGDPAAVEAAGMRCKELGAKRVAPLKVSGAFHSPLMEPARLELEAELSRVDLEDPEFPVIANVTAELVTDAATARRLLALQLTAPVRWVDCMQAAAREAGPEAVFVEIGPGNVLAGLLKRILAGARVVSIAMAEDVERFLEAA